jgi:hypothetical protein
LWRLQLICHAAVMALLDLIQFSEREKLEVLQRLDGYRKWRSLEEKRYCLVCGKIIAGHDIQVIGGTRGTGPERLICSTRGCHSIPIDWVLPTDEVLAKMSILENERPIERSRPKILDRKILPHAWANSPLGFGESFRFGF